MTLFKDLNLNKRVIFLLLALFITISVTLIQVGNYRNRRANIEQMAMMTANQQADNAALIIDDAFEVAMAAAQTVADDLSSGELAYADIQTRVRAEMRDFPALFGIAITFEPFVYDPEQRLYQVYISRGVNGELDVLDGATYDYTQSNEEDPSLPDTRWYAQPLQEGAMWNTPFFATGAQQVLVEYAVPFQQVDELDQRGGVVTVDYTLTDMRDLISEIDLGATGYAFVVSEDGTILAHPVAEFVASESLLSLAEAQGDTAMIEVARRIERGESFTTELVAPLTGQVSWVFSRPIMSTGWSISVVLSQDDFAPKSRDTFREQVNIALTGALAVWLLICLILRIDRGRVRDLFLTAASFSLICVALIMFIWYQDDRLGRDTSRAITSQTLLDSYLTNVRNNIRNGSQELLEIPTGVVIEAVDFASPTSATVNGLVWQRIPIDTPDEFIEGFRLTRITGPEFAIDELYRQQQDDETIVIWSIGIILKQNFNPELFPFDTRSLELRLEPLDLSGNVVLVPDLGGYDLIAPSLAPGVDPDVTLYNWEIDNTQYQYRQITNASNFGLQSRLNSPPTPSLFYVMTLQRLFLGPFIAYLMPGIIVALMIYAYLLRDRDPGDEGEIDNTLNYAAALFFVVVVSHTALRDNIAAVGVTYLEYFYILLYCGLALVAANDILIAKRPQSLIVTFQNNLLPRLLFFPIVSGVMLVITLNIFVFGTV